MHDDLVNRVFTAEETNRLWLTDITEFALDLSTYLQGRVARIADPQDSARFVDGGVDGLRRLATHAL